MNAGVTSFRSILDKPLTQLTEEDISQLTREDCRTYLKEKGMRRPSWNKSQAIQQVISLKALLEPSEDSGAGALRKILVSKPQTTATPPPPPATLNSGDSVKETSGDANNIASVSVEVTVPGPVNDSPRSAQLDSHADEADYNAVASRSPGAVHGSIGQLTIFYSGKVNVYDGVPPDKAQAIMQLAASPIEVSMDDAISGNRAFPFPCHLQIPSDKRILSPSGATISPNTPIEKITEYPQQWQEKGSMTHDREVPASRKLSLQRYLEKRKDRGRFKGRKSSGPSSSGLEVYLSQHLKTHTSNEQSPHSSTSSPTQPPVQHALCFSSENEAKIANFSVDLNEGNQLKSFPLYIKEYAVTRSIVLVDDDSIFLFLICAARLQTFKNTESVMSQC